VNNPKGEYVAAIADLLGDDIDGAAAMMEDLDWML